MLKIFWNKVDNYKRTIGIIVTIIGYILKQFSDSEELSKIVIDAGITISIVGVSHFFKKEYSRKRNGG